MMIVDGLGMARNMAKSTTEHGRGGGHGMVERDSQSQRSSHENSVRWLRDVSASSSNWAQEGEGFNGVHHRHSHLPGETVAARSQGASRRSEGRCELPNGVNLLLSGSRGQDQLVSGRDKWYLGIFVLYLRLAICVLSPSTPFLLSYISLHRCPTHMLTLSVFHLHLSNCSKRRTCLLFWPRLGLFAPPLASPTA